MNRPQKRAQGLILQFVFVSCFRKRLLMIVPSHAGGSGENAAAQAWANAFNLSYDFVFWKRGYSGTLPFTLGSLFHPEGLACRTVSTP
jgi:hypothetical protein